MTRFAKIPYELGKKTVGAVRKMNVKGTANAAMNIGTGVAVGSTLPMSAGPQADKDIARMRQYIPKR
jgi:hypothetical protein